MRRKLIRRRIMRSGLLFSNIVILLIVLVFVLQSNKPQISPTPSLLRSNSISAANLNPVDQLSSANIALTVARLNSLPETTAITNQAQTQQADMAITSSDSGVVTKPQVVSTTLKSKDNIITYTAQDGDTFASLAIKFGVTSDTIRWSNPSVAFSLTAGTKLIIMPLNGLAYTVKAGDTVESLATKFSVSKDQIVLFNDTELSGLKEGELIGIPNGSQAVLVNYYGFGYSASWGGPVYGSNGYSFGYCTWYVANQVNVPNNWGDAYSWATYARSSGWNVSSNPTVNAIAQTPAGWRGHVAVVKAINPDGTIWISEMNAYGLDPQTKTKPTGGWGIEDLRLVSASSFPNYISH